MHKPACAGSQPTSLSWDGTCNADEGLTTIQSWSWQAAERGSSPAHSEASCSFLRFMKQGTCEGSGHGYKSSGSGSSGFRVRGLIALRVES